MTFYDSLGEWASSFLNSNQIVDLYFVLTDLLDIPWHPGEYEEVCALDSLATGITSAYYNEHGTGSNRYTGDNTPIGKTVL